MKPRICVDLDGTLAQYDGWKGIDVIGDPIPGAQEFMQAIRAENLGVMTIFTVRVSLINYRGDILDGPWRTYINDRINAVAVWFAKHNIVYDDIWSGVGKPHAKAYIDDRALNATAHVWAPEFVSDGGMCKRVLAELRGLCNARSSG